MSPYGRQRSSLEPKWDEHLQEESSAGVIRTSLGLAATNARGIDLSCLGGSVDSDA